MTAFVERERRNDDERHGTPSGAYRHSMAGEDPCDACRAAKAEYDKRYRAAPARTRKSRLTAKAQSRAYAALAKAHPEEYRALYVSLRDALLEAEEAQA